MLKSNYTLRLYYEYIKFSHIIYSYNIIFFINTYYNDGMIQLFIFYIMLL